MKNSPYICNIIKTNSMILVGSKAIKHHYPDFPREPKDDDYMVGSVEEIKISSRETEYLYNPVIGNLEGIADPNLLYTLKASHIVGWDINWEKHMFDSQFLKKKGCTLDRELFFKLYDFWNKIHEPNHRSDLDMTGEEFFDNAVKCEYDHDYIHTLLKPTPTYTKVLKDGAEVDVSEDKFNNLTFEEKCDLVREEVEVMSWERWSKKDYRVAYNMMLKKFIMNHAPIWEAIFIIENYVLLQKPIRNHFKIIESQLKNK